MRFLSQLLHLYIILFRSENVRRFWSGVSIPALFYIFKWKRVLVVLFACVEARSRFMCLEVEASRRLGQACINMT